MSDQKQNGEAVLWTFIVSQTFSVYLCLECHIYWAESRWDLSCSQILACRCREHFVPPSFFTVVNLSFASEEHVKICHYHIVAEANKNTLTPAASHIICVFREEESGFWAYWLCQPLNMYVEQHVCWSSLLLCLLFNFISFVLLFVFLINMVHNQDLSTDFVPSDLNECWYWIIGKELLKSTFSCDNISAGAVYSAGSVPRCGGRRDGPEAPPPVVGGLADSGPHPAQPGRAGPGESGRILRKNEHGVPSRTSWRRNKVEKCARKVHVTSTHELSCSHHLLL